MRDLLPILSYFPRGPVAKPFAWRRLFLVFVSSMALALPAQQVLAALGASVTLPSGQPGTIYPGQITELQITLSNSDSLAPISNVAFAGTTTSNGLLPGTLPNGLKIAGAATYSCYDPSSGTTSPGTGTLSATQGTQTVSLSGGAIPARANGTDGYCSIVIPVTSGTSSGSTATYTYTLGDGTVTGTGSGTVANSGAVNQSINVLALAKPSMSKAFGSSTLFLGGSATTLTITLSNSNGVAISNFSVADVFPQLGGAAIIQVANSPNASNTCGASFSPNAGDTSLSVSGGTIPANGSCQIKVDVSGKQTNGNYSTGAQTNTINGTTQFSNDVGIPAAANATASVTVNSPLGVNKWFAHSSLSSGQTDSFTVTLSNSGNTPLTIISFTDDPIDGTTAGNTNNSGLKVNNVSTTCGGGTATITSNNTGVTLTGGVIPAGGSCSVTVFFTGTVQTLGTPVTYTNTIPQGAVKVGDPTIVSQTRSASILVADELRVQKTATPAQVAPGNPVQYTVTVQNYSASPIASVVVTDHLSNGLTFLAGTINGNNYTPTLSGAGCANLAVSGTTGSQTPIFTFDMPARSGVNSPSACSVTFYAMASTSATGGSSTANIINAGDVCYNTNCNGGPSPSTGGTVTTTLLSATKYFDGATSKTYPEGTISTLKILLSNNSANALTNVSLSDTLPTSGSGQLRVANPANAATTCGGSPTITAAPGSTSLSLNGASIPGRASNGTGAAGSCFIQVDVVGPAGTYTNVATVGGTETYADGTTHLVGPITSSSALLTYTSALSATKSFNPATVSSGGTSTVTVHLANTSAAALAGVSVTDPLPTGMVLAPTPHAYTTCSGTTSVTATAGAGSASLSGADIAGYGGCDFVFDVVATGSANWTNTIPAGNITANGGVSNVTAVTGTLAYQSPTNLVVSMATNPSTLTFPGQVSQLTITIQNGSEAVTNLHLTDYFTANGTAGAAANGMVIAANPGASTTCPGGLVSTTAGGGAVGVSGVSLAANASCTVTVNVTSSAVGGITDYFPVGGIVTDQGLTNSGQASTSLTTQSNVGITKQFTPNVMAPGSRSRLRITFLNPTNQPMTAVAVLDTLPAGVTVPAGANPSTTCSGATVTSPSSNQVQVANGTIPSASSGIAASCYVEIDVLAATQGDYVNTIPAGAVTGTSGGSSVTNSQPTSDTLRVKSSLTVHKAFTAKTLDSGNPDGFSTGVDSTTPGTARTLTVRLDNPNNAPLTNGAFTDALPTGLVVASPPNASTTCTNGTVFATAAGTSLRLAGATIPANGSCTVQVSVLSNISGTYTNTLAAGGVTTGEGVSNGEATSAQVIISTPPTVAKQFSPAVIPPSGKSTLSIFLGNSNGSAITLSAPLTDTLPTAPGNIVVAPAPNVAGTCSLSSVTATAGSGSVTYASGATIPAGGCYINVDVTGVTSGAYNNNIAAGALQTNLGNNQSPANAALTISTQGYVSGKVFKDNNVTPDGVFQTGTDTPLSGASVELHSGSSCAGALVASATTDSLGNYLFSGLAAGTYSVCEPVQPTGTVNGITTAGGVVSSNGSTGVAGTASNPTSTTSQITGIVLNADGGSGEISGTTGNNFAEVAQSSISGTVFLDQNHNGLQNGADAGIAGITVQLLNNSGTVVASTTTDANGNYSFSGLNPGTYSVREPNQPSGTSNGITTAGAVGNGGTAGTPTGVTTVPSQISSIVLPPNTTSSGNNFAENPNSRTVSGTVFLDYNGDALLNNADHGIGGQTINLTGTDINGNPVSRSVTTAADGSYNFADVPEGTYVISQPSQPAGTTNGTPSAGSGGGTGSNPSSSSSQIANINLTGTTTVAANNNFAEIPGAAPDLAIAKTHSPATFAAGGATGYYTLTPSNIGLLATSGTVTVVDTLPAGMTPTSASGSGWSCNLSGQTVSCTTAAVMAASSVGNPITVHVAVGAALTGQVLTNTAVIAGGGEPAGFEGNNSASDPTPVSSSATLSGHVWRDTNHNRVMDAGEVKVAGWTVELLLSGTVVASTVTDAGGAYSFAGLAPSGGYQVRFREPTTGSVYGVPVPNESGNTFTNGVVDASTNPAGANNSDGTLKGLIVTAGADITQQSLPLDPSGVVYNSVTRQPVAGATVTLSGPVGFTAANVVGGSLTQTTGANGFYQFQLLSSAPAGTYTLTITSYPAGYLPATSTLIPVCQGTLSVGATPNPALVQSSEGAPASSIPNASPAACPGLVSGGSATTQYYFSFNLNPTTSANVVNNHIPLDPILGGAIVMTKMTPLLNVTKGDLVPYTLTATNTLSSTLVNIDVQDQIPAGFRYRTGSAILNGIPAEPKVAGRVLTWRNLSFAAGEKKTFKLILVVGAGVSEGEYVNQTWALNNIVGSRVSNLATAAVRVVPDPNFDCSDIIGKVFDDKNANGYQDQGEPGIANVRLATPRGLLVTTDAEGRFHIACADIPQADHGSNFVMKLDERTLPSGFRLTTENPRDVRVTRGKMAKLNFGATVHRVVRLEVSAGAFAGDSLDLLPAWEKQLESLIVRLAGRPSVLRIAYGLSTGEVADLGKRRLDALTSKLKALWQRQEGKEQEKRPPLVIETEMEGGQ